jgi:hypothetical protein
MVQQSPFRPHDTGTFRAYTPPFHWNIYHTWQLVAPTTNDPTGKPDCGVLCYYANLNILPKLENGRLWGPGVIACMQELRQWSKSPQYQCEHQLPQPWSKVSFPPCKCSQAPPNLSMYRLSSQSSDRSTASRSWAGATSQCTCRRRSTCWLSACSSGVRRLSRRSTDSSTTRTCTTRVFGPSCGRR